jgi:cation diffusion facilitator family transporter
MPANPLSVAVTVTLGMGAIKLAVAFATGSQAVLASAADSLADAGVSALNRWAMRTAALPPDAGHPFGHGKTEALASLAQGLVLSGIVLGVGYGALARLADPTPPPVEVGPALAVMVGSMIGSLVISTGLSRAARRTGSLILQTDAVHYRMDIWTGLAVLTGLGVTALTGGVRADAVASLVVCGMMARDIASLLTDAVGELMDRPLPAEEQAAIEVALAAFSPRLVRWHDLRTRRAGPDRFAQVRLVLPDTLTLRDAHALAHDVEAAIEAAVPGVDVLVHVDAEPARAREV